MKNLILIASVLAGQVSQAQTMKPQVMTNQTVPAAVAPAPAASVAPAQPAVAAAATPSGIPVQIPVVPTAPAQPPNGQQQPPLPIAELLAMMQKMGQPSNQYKNGAGPTGNDWSSGSPDGSPGSTGATPGGAFSLDGSGQCGAGQDMWRAAGSVMSEGVIPPGQGFNLNAPNWPKLTGTAPNSLRCDFAPGKQSMCTSATAAAFCQHIADLSNSGKLSLNSSQISFLNGPEVRASINGNTFSMAYMFQFLGGASIHGKGGDIKNILSQAKTGDVLRIDRTNKTGHSTIFKEVKGDQFCYWTSNTGTNGVGVQCENISTLTQVVVSRFPDDLKSLPAKIDKMTTDMRGFNSNIANRMQASQVSWANGNKLECTNSNTPPVHSPASTTTPAPAIAGR